MKKLQLMDHQQNITTACEFLWTKMKKKKMKELQARDRPQNTTVL